MEQVSENSFLVWSFKRGLQGGRGGLKSEVLNHFNIYFHELLLYIAE